MAKATGIRLFKSRKNTLVGTWRDGGQIVLRVKREDQQFEVLLETFEAENLINQLAGHVMQLTGAMPAIEPEET